MKSLVELCRLWLVAAIKMMVWWSGGRDVRADMADVLGALKIEWRMEVQYNNGTQVSPKWA